MFNGIPRTTTMYQNYRKMVVIRIEVKLISYPSESELIAKIAAVICYSKEHQYDKIKHAAEIKPQGYLRKIIKDGHTSIIEHNIFVFYVSGISRVCYDKKTEIYTKSGWKYLKDVTKEDEFLTRKEKGSVEFQKSIDIINYKYEGRMHRYKSQNFDLLVTPNHSLFTRRYDLRKNESTNFSLIPSNQLPQKRMLFDKRIIHNHSIPDTITIKGHTYIRKDNKGRDYLMNVPDLVIDRAVFFRFLAWYLSEGNTQYNSKENSHQIRIYQSTKKQANRNEIEETIIRLGCNPNRLKNCIQFKSNILGKFLKKLGKSYEKEIPFDLFNEFNRKYARIFLRTYAKGDGTVEPNGHVRLYTTSKRMANQLQMLSFIAGYTASIWVDNRIGLERNFSNASFKNKRECYVISLSKGKRNRTPVMKKDFHFSTTKYYDNVYCVEVPKHHVIFVRRNGKALWSGNCSHQLVRKRIASFSQQSQRYVNADNFDFVIPEAIQNSKFIEDYKRVIKSNHDLYQKMVDEDILKEDARFILPNATITQLIVSMNAHALMDFFVKRICCYDEETEVLTKKGWKFFTNLNKNDRFYSLNLSNGNCEYVKAVDFINEKYTGKMIRVKSQSVDLLVTPNHNNVVSHSYDNKKFILEEASNCNKHKRILMKKNCKPIKGKKEEYFKIKGSKYEVGNQFTRWKRELRDRYVKTKDLFLFLGMYLADGYAYRANYHYNVGISEVNKDGVNKYSKILASLTSNKVRVYKHRNSWRIEVHDRSLYDFFKPFGKAKEKRIPDFVWSYDYSLLSYIFEGLSDGDMTKRETGKSYSTISFELANDIQRLLLHLGYSGTISVLNRIGYVSKTTKKNGQELLIPTRNIEYRVSINEKKNEPIIKTTNRNAFSEEDYKGNICCVELENNNTLYVRRNGRTVWSGNSRSQWEIRKLAEKMLEEVKKVAPIIFKDAGAFCDFYGYCPENDKSCGKSPTIEELLDK